MLVLCTLFRVTLFLVLVLVFPYAGTAAGMPPANLHLAVVKHDSVNTYLTIRDTRQKHHSGLVAFHFPRYLRIHDEVDRTVARAAVKTYTDGSATITGGDKDHIRFSLTLIPDADYVDIVGTAVNRDTVSFDARAMMAACLDVSRVPAFLDHTGARAFSADGDTLRPVAGGEEWLLRGDGGSLQGTSFIARSNADGTRHVALAWDDAWSVAYRTPESRACVMSNPRIGALPAGGRKRLKGRIYLVSGPLDGLFARFMRDFPGLGRGDTPLSTGLDAPFVVRATTTDGESVTITVEQDYGSDDHLVQLYRKKVAYLAYTGPDSRIPVGGSGARLIAEARFGADSVATFTDTDVGVGDVLAYRASVNDYETELAVVRVRDPRTIWGPVQVDDAIVSMFRRFAGRVRVTTHGETVDGWPLRSVSAGNRQRMIAIVGGIHPGEAGPEFLLPVFEQLVAEAPDLLARVGVAVLPLLCADTRKRLAEGHPTYLRTNANGVDLNRNFAADWERVDTEYGYNTSVPGDRTYRGPYPASEPETQAAIDFTDTFRPEILVSMHGPGILLLSPRTGDADVSRRLRDTARLLINAYQAGDSIPGASTTSSGLPGTLSRWATKKRGIRAYDQENDVSEESVALNNHLLTREGLATFRQRNYRMWRGILEHLAQ